MWCHVIYSHRVQKATGVYIQAHFVINNHVESDGRNRSSICDCSIPCCARLRSYFPHSRIKSNSKKSNTVVDSRSLVLVLSCYHIMNQSPTWRLAHPFTFRHHFVNVQGPSIIWKVILSCVGFFFSTINKEKYPLPLVLVILQLLLSVPSVHSINTFKVRL